MLVHLELTFDLQWFQSELHTDDEPGQGSYNNQEEEEHTRQNEVTPHVHKPLSPGNRRGAGEGWWGGGEERGWWESEKG